MGRYHGECSCLLMLVALFRCTCDEKEVCRLEEKLGEINFPKENMEFLIPSLRRASCRPSNMSIKISGDC